MTDDDRRDRLQVAALILAHLTVPGDTLKTPKGFEDAVAESARRAVLAADLLLAELDRTGPAALAGGTP